MDEHHRRTCCPLTTQLLIHQVALDKLPDYGEIATEVFVRITDLPIQDSIRDLRCCTSQR